MINPIKYLLLKLIRSYQLVLSPLIGANCRFMPTCSHYTYQAVQTFGVIKGLWLGVKRMSKCHPWGSSGYDPVKPVTKD